MTDAQFAAITQRIHRETGIVIGAAKRSMLISRLAHRLRHLGLTDFAAYIRVLDSVEGEEERHALISAITTNVTRFFREPHHFDALSEMALALVARARAGGRVRIWSAGCSTGQEPYSIAATLVDRAPEITQLDLRILATDIDAKVIETARRGIYDQASLGQDVPVSLRRHLQETPDGRLAVSSDLRSLIRFEPLNLLGIWPFTGQFDIVFCRNVVIYFDAETRHSLWRRFSSRILPQGQLFLGHSERMDPRLDPYFEPCGITRYRRTDRNLAEDGPSFPVGET
ncbi:CheR family methyltransferase [Paragemmobacter ruber]|uniref:CheR family methyltransferase n=1 Tax=Paragemmobacter ruber TaxID=1985673 RepID=UPI00191C0B87|nr:protein-glutamate O-methyltransferase CheR [Rhodobacter ruber]